MTLSQAKEQALQKHEDCEYAEVYNGMSWNFQRTWVVKLWRNEECYLNEDPPKYIEDGFAAN